MFASPYLRRRVTALSTLVCLVALALLALPGSSSGARPAHQHVVLPGETLWGIASATYGGDGRLVALDLVDALEQSAGTYEGDVAGFIGRALPLIGDLAPVVPASASALRRARLHALTGGGEATDGRAVLRVAG